MVQLTEYMAMRSNATYYKGKHSVNDDVSVAYTVSFPKIPALLLQCRAGKKELPGQRETVFRTYSTSYVGLHDRSTQQNVSEPRTHAHHYLQVTSTLSLFSFQLFYQ